MRECFSEKRLVDKKFIIVAYDGIARLLHDVNFREVEEVLFRQQEHVFVRIFGMDLFADLAEFIPCQLLGRVNSVAGEEFEIGQEPFLHDDTSRQPDKLALSDTCIEHSLLIIIQADVGQRVQILSLIHI